MPPAEQQRGQTPQPHVRRIEQPRVAEKARGVECEAQIAHLIWHEMRYGPVKRLYRQTRVQATVPADNAARNGLLL